MDESGVVKGHDGLIRDTTGIGEVIPVVAIDVIPISDNFYGFSKFPRE